LDADFLEQIPEHLRAKVAQAFARIEVLEKRNALLSEKLRLLLIKRYGPSAERLSDGQLALLELEPGVAPPEVESEAARDEKEKAVQPPSPAEPSKPKQKPVRVPLPAHLPREERIVSCPPDQCHCTQCGDRRKVIGYEVSERLSIKPIEFFVEVTKREKLACARCEEMGVSVAPVPAAIIEKGILSDSMVIDVITKKYLQHLPLYRQSVTIEREAGVAVSQATLSSSVLAAGALLMPLCGAMRSELLASGYIQVDETTVPVQSKRTKGKDHQAYFWVYSRPEGPVVYNFRMGREREGPKIFLAGYDGRLQCDGYSAYDKIGANIVYFGCMAHARRKFFDASKLAPGDVRSVAIIEKIGKLYEVEGWAREANLSYQERESLRLEKSVPILAELKAMVLEARDATLPKNALGKACTYALGQWERLERYASPGHGQVEIDNNLAENTMRTVALGRKNWIHVGSEEAGPKIAAILSVLETCKRLKMNAREYLEEVLPRLGGWSINRIAELTPLAWLRAHNQAA
jgi:transposase